MGIAEPAATAAMGQITPVVRNLATALATAPTTALTPEASQAELKTKGRLPLCYRRLKCFCIPGRESAVLVPA